MSIYKTIEIDSRNYDIGFQEVDLDSYLAYALDESGSRIISIALTGSLLNDIKSQTRRNYKDMLVDIIQGAIEDFNINSEHCK